MADKAHFEFCAQLLHVRVNPVTLGDESRLALCKGCNLVIIAAVDKDVGICIVKEHLKVVSKSGQAFLIKVAFECIVINRRIIVIKIAGIERVEYVLGSNPPQAAGNRGADRDNIIDAKFSLHAV